MTPEEARTKWCPMVRHSGDYDEPASNRAADGFPVGLRRVTDSAWNLCVAEDCMMWRWHPLTEPAKSSGYCGLAGEDGSP